MRNRKNIRNEVFLEHRSNQFNREAYFTELKEKDHLTEMKNIIQTKLCTQKTSNMCCDFACLNFQHQNSVPFKTTHSNYTDSNDH